MGGKDSKHVLVMWADEKSSNLGVQALAVGTRCLIEAVVGEADITHVSYGKKSSASLEITARNLSRAMAGVNREMERWLASFDLVIDTGAGDSFADIYGLRRLAEMSAMRALVRRSRVPLVMGPQTIGPFDSRVGRWLAQKSIGAHTIVLARDSASRDAGEALLDRSIQYASDVAFLLPVSPPVPRDGVVLNVSGLLWSENPHVDYRFYRKQVLRFAELVQASGKDLTLLSHVIDASHTDNDIHATRECWEALDRKPEVYHPAELSDARTRLAQAEVVVAARMHAVLNSLSQGVPAIGWSYSRKFAPLLDDIGWSHVFDLKTSIPSTADDTFAAIHNISKLSAEADAARVTATSRLARVSEYLTETVVFK